ncbi:hypothetical protein LEP1GSC170_3036 [Leptospira interrogans serovar Bataviae str. HAI135]|nr:hypothetical protein LEP1GSC170_3036 [Leptospira interrogans serovar Bataviae str. HAI135]
MFSFFLWSIFFFFQFNFSKVYKPKSGIRQFSFFRIQYSSLALIFPSFYYFLKDYFSPKEKGSLIASFFVVFLIGLFFAFLIVPFSWVHIVFKICQLLVICFSVYILFFQCKP